jgi:hypothetical protein
MLNNGLTSLESILRNGWIGVWSTCLRTGFLKTSGAGTMFKLMITMKRKKGMSQNEFQRYYNDRHLAFVHGISPPPKPGVRPATLHRRNFIRADDALVSLIGDGRADKNPPFDVITEVVYETREDAAAALEAFFQPSVINAVKSDEENFIEDGSIKSMSPR